MELQVERGVVTTRLQRFKGTVGKRESRVESKENENTPLALVVVLATTFPAPHRSCT